MEFKPGEDVVHPNYGIGRIVRMEQPAAVRRQAQSGGALSAARRVMKHQTVHR